jgi:hypothetical protein
MSNKKSFSSEYFLADPKSQALIRLRQRLRRDKLGLYWVWFGFVSGFARGFDRINWLLLALIGLNWL